MDSDVRLGLAAKGREDFYFFCKVILGYKDMVDHFHLPICEFIQQTEDFPRRLILLPRSSFKSTLATIARPIWLLVRDPNQRILIISDTEKNASRFMTEIQNHFTSNDLFRSIYPEMIPENFHNATWNKTEMVVANRTAIWREPSIDAIGLGGGAESRHYDKIIADDTITEKAIHSDTEMKSAIEWTGGLESLLVKPADEIFWIGSRKRLGDLYENIISKFGGNDEEIDAGPHAVRKGELLMYSRAAIEGGEAIFPERIPLPFLNRLKETDPLRYNSQYANNPIDSGLNFFPPETLQFFEWSSDGNAIMIPGEGRISPFSLERMILYDPSKAEKKTSSKQALLVVAKGEGPNRFILEANVDHFPPDEAIDHLCEMYLRWKPGTVGIEHRGFQGSIKYWLQERTNRGEIPPLPIIEWPFAGAQNAQWSKVERIRGLIPLFRAGYVWLAPELRNSELAEEILYYPNVEWDDGIDALAMSLDFWPWFTDHAARSERKSAEDAHLLEMFGYIPEKEAWKEEDFLRSLGATGYGIGMLEA